MSRPSCRNLHMRDACSRTNSKISFQSNKSNEVQCNWVLVRTIEATYDAFRSIISYRYPKASETECDDLNVLKMCPSSKCHDVCYMR
jgi:hypothetical protein